MIRSGAEAAVIESRCNGTSMRKNISLTGLDAEKCCDRYRECGSHETMILRIGEI
jgi:hypothetical protein